MKANEIIREGDRIGTALWKSSIPAKYKQYPVIGQGATSVVLDKGDGNVIMLTRDEMKRDWLVHDWGLGIGDWVDSFDASHRQSRDLSDMPVYVIVLPKLFPLSKENKRVVKKVIEEYNKIAFHGTRNMMDALNNYLNQHPEGLLAQIAEFLRNYDEKQFNVDFIMRNFMQDANGKIVLVDPIVSSQIIDALHQISKQRYERKGMW